ncbi:hypothetical protein BBO99_00006055 [Phytophthora kernoviae]|uniref:Uncharacterized protein n=2 Tax=Phytophthora kernoviae TaxID=325452 RepID=A0A421GLW4_9STRA|nr:hypothetical protein G195_006740 [Phytophthora kernoviae 00238/432]KAG2522426.1 hypothetical protein JM16_005881 [Phytophthora kernoviae]KAG2524024.1 hypothetical protein JM18_005574 [Phytophthora kernoviae]RLN46072.1 hypothetical protein BBI17_006055 [Phytophthora kernoviae]RLN78299.1 hypothetical protein BBO99_00006055 [Phytophthora kernoviae]
MEPMRSYGDSPTGYESGIIKDSELLSPPILESIVFGVTVQWDPKSISAFVEVANSTVVAMDPPSWVTQPRGQITDTGFMSDVMSCLLEVAGGLDRENDLAPNTFLQSFSIMNRFGHIEADPFVQTCMAKLKPGAYFAAIFVRYECPGFGIQSARMSGPPRPSRQVFQ